MAQDKKAQEEGGRSGGRRERDGEGGRERGRRDHANA
jgi:small subunit ribosomal protein S3